MTRFLIFDATNHFARSRYAVRQTDYLNPADEQELIFLRSQPATEEIQQQIDKIEQKKMSAKIGLALHVFFSSVISCVEKFNPEHVVFAWDQGSWRRKIFDDYKKNRRDAREKESEEEKQERELFYQVMDDLIQQLHQTNVVNVHQQSCEADDIIATICHKFHDQNIVIVSTDSDFEQLLVNPHVQLYHPIKQELLRITPDEASYLLFKKIIRGDSGDGIPSAWPRVRETRIRLMFEDVQERQKAFEEREDFQRLFRRNEVLIDLSKVPQSIQERIIQDVQEQLTKQNEFDTMLWMEFVSKYKLLSLGNDLTRLRRILYG